MTRYNLSWEIDGELIFSLKYRLSFELSIVKVVRNIRYTDKSESGSDHNSKVEMNNVPFNSRSPEES